MHAIRSTIRQILLRITRKVAQMLPVRRVFFRYLLDFVVFDLVLSEVMDGVGVAIDATVVLSPCGRRLLA